MNTQKFFRPALAGIVAAVFFAIAAGAASAEPRFGRGPGPGPSSAGPGPRPGLVFDNHWHHGRYYPPRGVEVDIVPRGAYFSPRWRGGLYFHEGSWYRPHGPRFVVIAPPLGIVVPFLPPFYTTLWIGGFPYYYANDAYYAWRPEQRGYEVVTPPPREDDVSEKPPSDDIFIYPKRGQSEQQQATDRYECHRWALEQTGYDPTRPQDGSAGSLSQRRGDYQRAMAACLDGRGYSVK